MVNILQNFINGEFRAPTGEGALDVVNPVTEEVVASAPISGAADIDAAMDAAAKAFKSWKRTTPAERQLLLLKLADAMEARSDELVEAQHRNTGQVKQLIADEEVAAGANQIRFFAGAARLLEGKSAGEYMEGFTSYVRREPVGVIAQVTPWNYPLLMAIWKIGPALAAGNTIVLKPSDTTPESTLVLAELIKDIFPAGVFNVVLGNGETGAAMVAHRTPAMVSITGSVRAGIAVATGAAQGLKRAHLELGGKAPAVVFADADLAKTAEALAEFAFFNAGQDCTAVTRILVQESAKEEFLGLLKSAAEGLHTGSQDDSENYYGPLNNVNHFNAVSKVVDSLPEYATVVTGGHRAGEKGFFYAPTVIADVKQSDDVVQKETFGPVITVQTFNTEEEALELANDVEYALASSVWTSNHGTAMRVSRDLDFGAVWINTHIMLTAEMPHGGFKHSGYGKDLSMYGVEDYTRIKHVMSSLDA
ncbi:gamma-aminobutyraldehyde dehydrogenase [Psychromicrobium lacuslunae]|uniref:Phenylacetaldehyde dehydrogenase n=1 Tax=Psychromicrobium lacuslunae TaxID=1618207 RepID=A0A0D4C0G1_9MICC|nr:gamma-aminobutyraldehyde dehydrogenase [Psychromicrobium lacuslunae]AJT41856.1 phenylacetaldehyde dehydrogenase [Psychromicrobium lacuslunae]